MEVDSKDSKLMVRERWDGVRMKGSQLTWVDREDLSREDT